MARRPARRISVPYFLSGDTEESSGGDFLFTRDLPLGIMPLGSSTDTPEYAVDLEPHDPQKVATILQLLDIGHHRQRDFAGVVQGFVEGAAQRLGEHGEVYFEFSDEDVESPSRLCLLPPGRVWRVPGRYMQVVPQAARAKVGRFAVSIPADRIWHLRLPRCLGSPRAHRAMLERLKYLWGTFPALALDHELRVRSGYELDVHERARRIALEYTTRSWGTIPSLHHIKGTTEYMLIARRLQFEKSQAVLREHILTELNAFLVKARPDVGQVAVKGLRSAQEIADALEGLRRGDLSFGEATRLG